jgi:hypothetical protein
MTDVIPLVRHDWEVSFGRTEVAKKAIANRGWGALNYVLLDSPHLICDDQQKIRATKRKSDEINQEEVKVNHNGAVAMGYLAMLFEDKLKTDGLRKVLEERQKQIRRLVKSTIC